MKDINKLKDYREKYKRHYGIEDGICTKLTYSGIKVFELQLWYLDEYIGVIKEVSKWVEFKFIVDNGAKTYVEIEGVHKYGFQG